jgi:hypothetical protein
MSLGCLSVAMPEARDFVELLEPYLQMRQLCPLESDMGIIFNRGEVSGGNRGKKGEKKRKLHEG